MEFTEVDWSQVSANLIRLGIAYLIALPIGFDREQGSDGVGLRTFPLVAVGSCGYILLGLQVLAPEDAQAQARMLYGLMTGIGFIGGGAILKGTDTVHGTSTAASIWITGAIGAAVAWERYEIALVLSAITFVTLRWVGGMKRALNRKPQDERSSREGD